MRSIRLWTILIFVAAIGSAAAQPPPSPEGGPMREQLREKIRTMKIWKLTEEVGLTPEQSEKFFPVYNKHEKALEEIEIRRNELTDRLERMTNSSEASDKEIAELTVELSDIPRAILAERDRFMKEIAAILPVRQQAKLMVFEERFKQRLQEFIRDIRRQGRGPRMGD
jgi:Spy/CpxP family protein refolding chaperone